MRLWRLGVALVLLGGAGGLLTRVPGLRRLALRAAARVRAAAPAPPPRPRLRSETPAGLSLWIVDDSTKVFPGDSLGPPWTPGKAIQLEGARGETVAFQVVLASSAEARGLDVEAALKAPGGAIPTEVFLETYLDAPAVDKNVVSLGPGEYPDPLIPLRHEGRPVAAPFALEASRNQPLWVDVTIPRSVAPGRCSGSLRVHAGDRTIELPVELMVDDFELPAAPSLSAWVLLYDTPLTKAEGLDQKSAGDADRIVWDYYRMAHAHRLLTQIAEEEPRLRWDDAKGHIEEADWRAYDRRNGPVLDGSLFEDHQAPALWKVGGFMGWGGRFGGSLKDDADITPARRNALGEYAREIGRHFRERGWSKPRLFFYLIDEPDFQEHPNAARIVKAYGDAIHASGAGIDHLVTIAPQDSPIPMGSVDIWATWGAGYRPRAMAARQALGERAWFYQQYEPFVGGHTLNSEGLGLRTWGWIAWRYHVDGVFLWVGDYWNDDPYRKARNRNSSLIGDGMLFYPGPRLASLGYPAFSGPVSSFRMKALRRGLQDYEYLRLLQARGGDADALAGRLVRSALGEGEWDPIWRHPRWADHGDWSHDPAEWDAARREAARQIVTRRSP